MSDSEIQLSDALKTAWARFESSANWQSLHPLDVDRFYQFVWAAYQEGIVLGDAPLSIFVRQRTPSYAQDKLIARLEHARDLLDVVTERGRRA